MFDIIGLGDIGFGRDEMMKEIPVVGEYQKAFGILVQPAGRHYLLAQHLFGQELHYCTAQIIFCRGDESGRLVHDADNFPTPLHRLAVYLDQGTVRYLSRGIGHGHAVNGYQAAPCKPETVPAGTDSGLAEYLIKPFHNSAHALFVGHEVLLAELLHELHDDFHCSVNAHDASVYAHVVVVGRTPDFMAVVFIVLAA